ncbi:hypothetical protein F2P81_000600 [Scophthalmus maximus]|uniref:Uncharacterized protein n=2 Tax=Scophthalmus maximus TaxID=52904 RepID=A0A6A4TJI3_SCOMX|nr:hypothetical protein F2P81_000600 [Scophthalmus maximus]
MSGMCSVLRCDSSRRSAQRFKLPEDAEKRLEWVQFVLEVNGQRLKESCWTEISICTEHFTEDCFGNTGPTGTAQLKPGAVPSLFIKSEPDQPEPDQLGVEPDQVGVESYQVGVEPDQVKVDPDQPEPDQVKVDPDQVKVDPDQPEPDQVGVEPDQVGVEPDQVEVELDQVRVEPDQPVPDQVKVDPDQPEPDQVRTEPDQPEPDEEPVEIQDSSSQCEQLETCESPSYCSEESILSNHTSPIGAPVSPEPSDSSDEDYGQMVQKIANIDIIKEKVELLRIKGNYVVNEDRILQLFSSKCPLCGSTVKLEKVTHGILMVVNQQCLQCDYRNRWKNQAPSEESDPVEEMGESSDQGDMDSDEDWRPTEELFLANTLQTDSDEDAELEEEEELDQSVFSTNHSQLCTECGKFFRKRLSHTCEHKTKPYSCNICGKRCVSEIYLNLHSRIHDENYEHRCKYCNATFKTRGDKFKHEQIHQDRKDPYKCPDCPQTFTTNKERHVHLSEHKVEMGFKCGVCGLEFKERNHLRRHSVVHSGLKPHKCSVCQRSFNQPSHLKSHMRLHTGERPYKCRHCDKGFNHNVSLKSHVQRYHTSRSGQKKGKVNERASNTGDAQETVSKRGPDSETDNVEEEGDTEEEVQKEKKDQPKRRWRSSGRPKGRPKRNTAANSVPSGQNKDGRSNVKTSKSKVKKLKKTGSSDEESECEQSDGNMSFNSEEEEEEETKRKTGRSRKRPNNYSDSSFHPEGEKEKKMKYSSQNNGKSRRGRRKTAVI